MKEDYIEKQFVPYEIALKLKEIGFSEPCLAWYLPEIAEKGNICTPILASYVRDWNKMFKDRLNCPLWQQIIDWLDSEFGLLIVIVHDKKFGYQWKIITNKNKVVYDCAVTYQRLCDAREIAILKCIELINGRNI